LRRFSPQYERKSTEAGSACAGGRPPAQALPASVGPEAAASANGLLPRVIGWDELSSRQPRWGAELPSMRFKAFQFVSGARNTSHGVAG